MGIHTRNVLTVKAIMASRSKKLRDGGGLWLVTKGTGRYWILDYRFGGRRREMGLGPLHSVGLSEAREKAARARVMLTQGIDPLAERTQASIEERKKAADKITFGEFADAYIDAAVKAGKWRGAKTEARWRNLVEVHAASIRQKAIADITLGDVETMLLKLWGTKQETAEKLREAVEKVLDAARVKGHRTGENPAAWKGNLEHVLHKPDEVMNRGHHAAMPWADLPRFMTQLGSVEGVAARALEFAILTATRSGEARNATWDEIDFGKKVWTLPAIRMKAGKEHRVPLSTEALAILRSMQAVSLSQFVFPGVRAGKPLSDASLAKALSSAGGGAFTVHGFRSSFRDWATDEAHVPREIAEMALAHAVGDATERSYARSDALERRRKLMEKWAEFIS